MISFGFWLAGLFGKTVTQDKAKRIGLIVAIPLALLALGLLAKCGKSIYDRGVVEQYQDKSDAAIANATVQADRDATANALERANVTEAENARLANAMADAKENDPEHGTRVVGNVTQSYFDNLPQPKKRR